MSKHSVVRIPHPNEEGCAVAGILEQTEEVTVTKGRAIALILHGTAGHKDYLYQKRLARTLPIDSFRFDFRGNHETPGTWRTDALENDVADLAAVVAYLRVHLGYRIVLLVGHSRGSIVGFRWMCTAPEAQEVDGFVNVSGRYRMRKLYDSPAGQAWQREIAEKGAALWTPVVARRQLALRVTAADLTAFAAFDTSLVWDHFPAHVAVLTVHGLADLTVSPYDAVIYARALGGRAPGTHTLHLMEDAGHNFEGRTGEVVDAIVRWWDLRGRGQLRDGVWGEHGKEARL
ncbi:Alpha/Beta hydrolase protein [Schizophyllum amplum]|uniref:Alpha/Beta hydrolase protein n=1 Tax=Schizophyllum amplum TaxID=97359 RepID=A0A550CBI8_9AGAR|nr:Alpha/Beta hydrolase protein [Auriculariopsis ampla]